MKLPAWLTGFAGARLPPPWDRDESIAALLTLADLPESDDPDVQDAHVYRAGDLYDARIGDPRAPLVVVAEIVETLRREFT